MLSPGKIQLILGLTDSRLERTRGELLGADHRERNQKTGKSQNGQEKCQPRAVGDRSLQPGQVQQHFLDGNGVQVMRVTSPYPQIVCLIRKGVFGVGLFYVYLYSFLAVLGLRCCAGFSLVVARGGYSVVVAHDLLMTVASRHEHGL